MAEEVTVPRVVIFRDAIVDLFDMELGPRFNSKARGGIAAVMNYVGGAFIYIRPSLSTAWLIARDLSGECGVIPLLACAGREYAGRIKIIASSWKTANNKAAEIYHTPWNPLRASPLPSSLKKRHGGRRHPGAPARSIA